MMLSDFPKSECNKHRKIIVKRQISFCRMPELNTSVTLQPHFTR